MLPPIEYTRYSIINNCFQTPFFLNKTPVFSSVKYPPNKQKKAVKKQKPTFDKQKFKNLG